MLLYESLHWITLNLPCDWHVDWLQLWVSTNASLMEAMLVSVHFSDISLTSGPYQFIHQLPKTRSGFWIDYMWSAKVTWNTKKHPDNEYYPTCTIPLQNNHLKIIIIIIIIIIMVYSQHIYRLALHLWKIKKKTRDDN